MSPRPSSTRLDVGFSGHETFVLRYGWLKKAVDLLAHYGPKAFQSEEAGVWLGVGKNMVRSIRHWALSSRVLAEEDGRGASLTVTPLGEMLFGQHAVDPYLEDRGTLWLLHWLIATNEARSTTWSWSFSELTTSEFSTDKLAAFILSVASRRGCSVPSDKTLQRDVECFVRTYVTARQVRTVLEDTLDCPLAELGLIEALDGRTYRFSRGYQPSLPSEVFAYALADYWDSRGSGVSTMAFAEVAYGRNSPGMIFKLDEESLSARLEDLRECTDGKIAYGETSGLKQLSRSGAFDGLEMLDAALRRGQASYR